MVGALRGDIEQWTGASVLTTLSLSGIVLVCGCEWKGTKRGAAFTPVTVYSMLICTILLFCATLVTLGLALYRLAYTPDDLGSKDELGTVAGALAVIWYTDALCIRERVRRRRYLAKLLTYIPMFRVAKAGVGTPLPPTLAHTELVIRSASFQLTKTRKAGAYWRGVVCSVHEDAEWKVSETANEGGGIVVLHDEETQDGAGADLICPTFTHDIGLSKQHVANVIWSAFYRSRVSELMKWDSSFGKDCVRALKSNACVTGVLKGELRRFLQNSHGEAISMMHEDEDQDDDSATMLQECLWAAAVAEALLFLKTGKSPSLLEAFTRIPLKVQSSTSVQHFVTATCTNWKL